MKSPDRQNELFWAAFLEQYPFKKDTIDQARQVLLNLREAAKTEHHAEDAAEIWAGIERAINIQKDVTPLWRKRWTVWAASVLMILSGVAGWQIFTKYQHAPIATDSEFYWPEASGNGIREVSNSSQKAMLVKLPDDSKVTLQPGSRLRYQQEFKGTLREVFLVGEGFFDVKRNTEKPFIVYANDLITKVLGTSFNVRATSGSRDVIVKVKTGRVSVFDNHSNVKDPETKGIILKPNQQVSYSRGMDKLTKTLVEQPSLVVPQENLNNATFVNKPAGEILKALQEAYGIEILFDAELLSGCRLTSSLGDEPLFEQLDVLCEAIGASYKVVDAQIVVHGKKCE